MARDESRSESAEADSSDSGHRPVLLQEVVSHLLPERGGRFVDATLGAGGYAVAILESAENVDLLALDRDPGACELAGRRLQSHESRLRVCHLAFDEIDIAIEAMGWDRVDGIVADLGLSSLQLASANRGFSFQHDGPLDMRFDPDSERTAADLVNGLDERQLADIIYEYGEERRSRAIARRIVASRPVESTARLREIVQSVYRRTASRTKSKRRRAQKGRDPATRTFQALRIAVNDELGRLEALLEKAPKNMAVGARLVVVAYHSLEDRIVKLAFRELGKTGGSDGHDDDGPRFRVLTKKPVTPTPEEIALNARSRSAKLRTLERVS